MGKQIFYRLDLFYCETGNVFYTQPECEASFPFIADGYKKKTYFVFRCYVFHGTAFFYNRTGVQFVLFCVAAPFFH